MQTIRPKVVKIVVQILQTNTARNVESSKEEFVCRHRGLAGQDFEVSMIELFCNIALECYLCSH